MYEESIFEWWNCEDLNLHRMIQYLPKLNVDEHHTLVTSEHYQENLAQPAQESTLYKIKQNYKSKDQVSHLLNIKEGRTA